MNNDLDKLDFVGITKHFRVSLLQLNKQFGIDLVQYKANKTKSKINYLPQDEDLSVIREKNFRDKALYELATHRLLNNDYTRS